MRKKGDAETPGCRARLVSCELNRDGKVDAFSASTPAIGSKETAVRQVCIDQEKKPQAIAMIISPYLLPNEMGLSPDLIARQVRCIYGTCDAGRLWESTYTQSTEHAGFATGTANPCVFVFDHKARDI